MREIEKLLRKALETANEDDVQALQFAIMDYRCRFASSANGLDHGAAKYLVRAIEQANDED